MFYPKSKKNNGFSLLELILAVAIFSLSSYAIATMLIDSNISTKQNSERMEALFYAKEGIEAVRSIRDASSTNFFTPIDGTYGLSADSGSWELSGSEELIDNKYTRTVTIAMDPNALDPVKDVFSNISWNVTPNRVATVTLMTKLTDWRDSTNGLGVELSIPYVWVLNSSASEIYQLNTSDGSQVGDSIYTMPIPNGLAVDSQGNPVIIGQDGIMVQKINAETREEAWYNYSIQQQYNEWQGWEVTQGVAIDAEDDVWITTNFGRVFELSSVDGNLLNEYSSIITKGIVVDSDGNLYLPDADWKGVIKVSGSTGDILWQTTLPNGNDYRAYGIALDANNKVWVTSTDGYLYAVNATTGAVIDDAEYGYGGDYKGVAVDAFGNVWVANSAYGETLKFDNDGVLQATYAGWGAMDGISVDANNNVWVNNGDGVGVLKLSYPNYDSPEYFGAGDDYGGPYTQLGDATGFALQYFVLGRR